MLNSSFNNTIGGTAAAAGNVISGNTNHGITLDSVGTSGNLVQGNYIGADATGTGPIANGGSGIYIVNSASDNTIGGTETAAGNTISGNTGTGVVVATGTGNAILSNSIYGKRFAAYL